jgi:hypothetical protein
LPNPGTVAAGDKRAKLASAAGAKLLKSTTKHAARPGQLSLKVKATKAARSMLAATRKLKTKLKVVFTPTGGTPSTQIVKAKLKG